MTSLEKEDSNFPFCRHNYEVLPGSLLPYPHRPSMLIESPTHGVLVLGANDWYNHINRKEYFGRCPTFLLGKVIVMTDNTTDRLPEVTVTANLSQRKYDLSQHQPSFFELMPSIHLRRVLIRLGRPQIVVISFQRDLILNRKC